MKRLVDILVENYTIIACLQQTCHITYIEKLVAIFVIKLSSSPCFQPATNMHTLYLLSRLPEWVLKFWLRSQG